MLPCMVLWNRDSARRPGPARPPPLMPATAMPLRPPPGSRVATRWATCPASGERRGKRADLGITEQESQFGNLDLAILQIVERQLAAHLQQQLLIGAAVVAPLQRPVRDAQRLRHRRAKARRRPAGGGWRRRRARPAIRPACPPAPVGQVVPQQRQQMGVGAGHGASSCRVGSTMALQGCANSAGAPKLRSCSPGLRTRMLEQHGLGRPAAAQRVAQDVEEHAQRQLGVLSRGDAAIQDLIFDAAQLRLAHHAQDGTLLVMMEQSADVLEGRTHRRRGQRDIAQQPQLARSYCCP